MVAVVPCVCWLPCCAAAGRGAAPTQLQALPCIPSISHPAPAPWAAPGCGWAGSLQSLSPVPLSQGPLSGPPCGLRLRQSAVGHAEGRGGGGPGALLRLGVGCLRMQSCVTPAPAGPRFCSSGPNIKEARGRYPVHLSTCLETRGHLVTPVLVWEILSGVVRPRFQVMGVPCRGATSLSIQASVSSL